jgi:gamma-glutamylcyclotransferase (GGCT)/AIG2-like uncharacterized protein YtfP
MTTATTERQELHQAIERLPDSAVSQIKGYVERIHEETLEELEEAEDIAYIEAHKDDPVVPFDVKEFETA